MLALKTNISIPFLSSDFLCVWMDVNVINAEEFSLCCVETAALNDFIGIIYNTAAFKMIAGSIHVKMWKDKR